MDGKDFLTCGEPKRRKNESKRRLVLPVSMREWQRKQKGQMRNGGQALNGLPCGNEDLKQLGFDVLLRKPEPQRKLRNPGVERIRSTKSTGSAQSGC